VAYDESEEEEEEEEEEFYCVVCEKKFKNPKQLVNHEKSKKHQQKLAQLRAELREEEELLAGVAALLSQPIACISCYSFAFHGAAPGRMASCVAGGLGVGNFK
jgi:acetyl-CoA carboxylase beta subunit